MLKIIVLILLTALLILGLACLIYLADDRPKPIFEKMAEASHAASMIWFVVTAFIMLIVIAVTARHRAHVSCCCLGLATVGGVLCLVGLFYAHPLLFLGQTVVSVAHIACCTRELYLIVKRNNVPPKNGLAKAPVSVIEGYMYFI